jgi:predicted nucleic acid-binding protein
LRSNKNELEKTKILIDTSFLLPAFGIDVEEEVYKAIRHFRRFDVYYIELEILEAIWKILRIFDRTKLYRIFLGLESIKRTYKILEIPSKAYLEAIEIYDRGHKDYIDALLYTTAKHSNIPLLTIDFTFIEFLKKNGYQIKNIIITPDELL